MSPKLMNLRKCFEERGGRIFNPKIYAADFGQGFFEHEIDTKFAT